MQPDHGEYFNVAHIEPLSHIYGPGERFVIWLQGCSLACDGCWNRDMWSFKSRRLIHREKLFIDILAAPKITGITLLGGEPLQQSRNTLWLLEQLKLKTDLTSVLYTGLVRDEMSEQGMLAEVMDNSDLIISGRYDKHRRDTYNQWHGSGNQELIYPLASRIKQRPKKINEAEIIIEANGQVKVLGYPDGSLYRDAL